MGLWSLGVCFLVVELLCVSLLRFVLSSPPDSASSVEGFQEDLLEGESQSLPELARCLWGCVKEPDGERGLRSLEEIRIWMRFNQHPLELDKYQFHIRQVRRLDSQTHMPEQCKCVDKAYRTRLLVVAGLEGFGLSSEPNPVHQYTSSCS